MSFPEQVAYALRKEILDGVYQDTMRLPPERDLCIAFSTSRTTVRWALVALQTEGWIKIEQGRGSVINSLDLSLGLDSIAPIIESTPEFLAQPGNAAPIVQYALWLQAQVPLAAAAKAQSHDKLSLADVLDELERADGARAFFENDIFFMRQLLRISRNFVLQTMFNSLARIVLSALDHSSLAAAPLSLPAYLANRRSLIPAVCSPNLTQTSAISAALMPEMEKAYQGLFGSIDAGKHGK
jgi:DNA-binding FadR family transcriptional regulator